MEGENLRGQSRNKQTVQFWQGTWAKNARDNSLLVKQDFRKETMERWGYPDGISLERIPKRLRKAAILIAGGASLDWVGLYLEDLKRKEMDIVCGVSTLSVCAHFEVVPFAVVAVDSNAVVWKEQLEEWVSWVKKHQIPLILHPCVDPRVARGWPGPRWWFLPEQVGVPIFDAMPFMYPEITCRMLNAGCVANSQLEICDLLGYEVVFLAGVDFGFTEDKYGATLYKADGTSYERHHYLLWNNALRMTKKGVYTTEEMLSYRTNFHLVRRLNYTQAIRIGKEGHEEPGILDGVPIVNVEDLMRSSGWRQTVQGELLSEEQFATQCAEYLKEQGLTLAMEDKGPQLMHFGGEDPTFIPTVQSVMDSRSRSSRSSRSGEAALPQKESMSCVEKVRTGATSPGATPMQIKMTSEKLQELLQSGAVLQHKPEDRPQQERTVQLPQGSI